MSDWDGSYDDAVQEFARNLADLARDHWRDDVLGTAHGFVEDLDHGRDVASTEAVTRAYIDGYEQCQGEVLTWLEAERDQ